MNFSRQALLGIGMIVGGSVMLYAMAQQISTSDKPTVAPVIIDQTTTGQVTSKPLTIDINTEKRILAQKQKERAVRVAAQEQRAEQFLAEQEAAETQALAKARAENQQYLDNLTTTGGDSDSPEAAQNTVIAPSNTTATTATETITSDAKKAAAKKLEESKELEESKKQPPKSAQDYTIKSGDGLLKLARQYNVSVAALAQVNNIEPSATLQIGQILTVPSGKQVERLEREAAAAEQARADKKAQAKKSADAKREAQQKLRDARKEVKETDAKGSFGVQVALAGNQASADEVAKKFEAAGYKVKTSSTSRGVRVIVGPERGKIAALALKDKVNSDPEVNINGAWVLYWR